MNREPKIYPLLRAAWMVGAIITVFLLFTQPAEARIIHLACDTGLTFTANSEDHTALICNNGKCATMALHSKDEGPVRSWIDFLYTVPLLDRDGVAVALARADPTGYVEVELATVDKVGGDFSYLSGPTSHNCYPARSTKS